jgi:hypothetical protein
VVGKGKKLQLMDGENVVEGDENLLKHATEFYKNLFGHSERGVVGMGFEFPRMVNSDENDDLLKFSLMRKSRKLCFL